MVTKILPNAVASGGPLQPEPSTRIFASPPSSLCLPGVPSLDGQGVLKIISFKRSEVSFLRASGRSLSGAAPAWAPWKSREGRRTRQGAPFHNVSCAVSASP